MPDPKPSAALKLARPSAVSVIAGLYVLQCLILLAVGAFEILNAGILWSENPRAFSASEKMQAYENTALGIAFAGLGLLSLVAALGLFTLRRWAWLFALTLEGFTLTVGLVDYFGGAPAYIEMIIAILIVVMLNQEDVQPAFRIQEPGDSLPPGGKHV